MREEEAKMSSDLRQCPSCQRSFNPETYQKHVKICDKVFNQKRKQFNTQAQRIVEPEQKKHIVKLKREQKSVDTGYKPKGTARNDQPIGGAMPKWKMQSM